MDPLLLLRKQLKKGDEGIALHNQDGNVVGDLSQCVYMKLGPYIFPRDQTTNFRSKRGSGDFYSLDAVWFCQVKRDAPYGEYIQEARRMMVGAVSMVDKRELLAFLDGEMPPEQNPYIDLSAPLPRPRRSFGHHAEEDIMEEEEMAGKGIVGSTTALPEMMTIDQVELQHSATSTPTMLDFTIRPARPRDASLVCAKDFSDVLALAQDVLKGLGGPSAPPNATEPPQSSSSSSSSTAATTKRPTAISLIEQIANVNQPTGATTRTNQPTALTKPKNVIPIIVVSAAPTALLTTLNALPFLADSTYLTTAEAKAKGIAKQNTLSFEHRFTSPHGEKTLKFQLVDNPTRITPEDWSRVIAVFLHGGATWQFKGWKWETPLEILQHVRGFSLEWDDAPVDPKVANWNVQRLTIQRTRRHADATAVHQFWSSIEEFLRRKNFL